MAEVGGSLGPDGQSSLTDELHVQQEILSQNTVWRKASGVDIWPLHAHSHVHMHLRVHMRKDTPYKRKQ